jgi:phage baseplate assembly protein W
MSNYSPALPLTLDPVNGFSNTQSISAVVKQNLKMLLLTSPGERIMDPTFGVGLRRYLFEQNAESVYSQVRVKIRRQVQKYMDFLKITEVKFSSENENSNIRSNSLLITIIFFIEATGETGVLGITL